jgi:hypothetical protein
MQKREFKEPKKKEKMTLFEGYNNYVYKLHLILESASSLGIPVNNSKRLNLKVELEKELSRLDDEINLQIPVSLLNLKPRRKLPNGSIEYGFKRTPKEVRSLLSSYNQVVSSVRNKDPNTIIKPFSEIVYKKYGLVEWVSEISNETFYCKTERFKPSSQQLIKYLKWKKDFLLSSLDKEEKKLGKLYSIPINFKTKKPTTGKEELKELVEKTDDPVLTLVQEYRSIKYNLTNSIPNWEPDEKGNVHTTWGFTAPTGQLDSRLPNILNCSKHTKTGQIFRGIIEAPKGYCFVEFDYKSFHVAIMGFLANDKSYIRFSQLDPHSIFASHLIKGDKDIYPLIGRLGFSDDSSIMGVCRLIKMKYKEIRQGQAKPTVLGNQLGLGPRKLQRQNRKYIKTLEEAIELQGILKEEFPKVEKAKERILEEAFITGRLVNEFGRVQWFNDVYNFTWDKKIGSWKKNHGEDHEKALAFAVQSRAFGMIQDKILEMEKEGWNKRFGFNNSIHDQVSFMPRIEEKEECLVMVKKKLEEGCLKLVNEATGEEGLKVGVEASSGLNWRDWDEKSNPEGMREVKV